MEDAEEIVSFDQCPLEKVVVYMNGYAEIRRRATVRLSLGPLTTTRATSPGLLPKTQPSMSNVSNTSARGASPSGRRSTQGVVTRRHNVVVRGLPGACLAADSLRVEMLDYKASAPISLDDVQLVYPSIKQLPPGQDSSKQEPSLTTLLEQKSLRDQIAHVRRRYESALARKHRLLAQRNILDRVADSMTMRGTSPMPGSVDIYGNSSLFSEQNPQQQQSMMQTSDHGGGSSSASFVSPHFIDALQGFLQLYDDRTHKVDDSLADTQVEIDHLEEQLNHLASLCSDADMRAPSPHLLMLTLSHFVMQQQNLTVDEANFSQAGRLSPSTPNLASASQYASVTFSISYTVYGAFWNPAYELRLRPDDSAVQLVYSVAITQTTGEDWLFEKEGDDDSTCARLFVSTSHASVNPMAPAPPTADRIYVRGGGACNTLGRHMGRKQQNNSNNNRMSGHRGGVGLSTPNLYAAALDYRRLSNQAPVSTIDETAPLIGRSASPAQAMFSSSGTLRPYSVSSLNHLYQQQTSQMYLMYNDTNGPDMLNSQSYQQMPIQHASSFAAFTPGNQSTVATGMAPTTCDYDNELTYALPTTPGVTDNAPFSVGESLVPTGIFFEAQVTSAASVVQPNKTTMQYVLSTGATVQLAVNGKKDDARVVVVKVPTVRQSGVTPVKFVVGCHDLEVINLSYEATPRLAASAFARAHLRNTSPLPLLAGSVAVFHDRASGSALFAYRTQLPYVAVGDDFLVALGPDPEVVIQYEAPQRRSMISSIGQSKMTENLEESSSTWKWSSKVSRSRSHDVSLSMNNLTRYGDEDAENRRAQAMARWTYYRQMIGITNSHERAVVRVHLVEPLPRPADKSLRLVLEAPALQEVDKQVDEKGKTVRSSRKAKLKPKVDNAHVAKLNSNHQLEWDLILRAGETKYLEVRYRLELKPGFMTSSSSANTNSMRRNKNKKVERPHAAGKDNLLFDAQQKSAATVNNPQLQLLHPTPAMGVSSLPRPSSATKQLRPASPFAAQNVAVQHNANSQGAALSKPANISYQIHPILNAAQVAQYRGQQQQQYQQEQRMGGVRYTAC